MEDQNKYISFLGTGWSFPPSFSKDTKSLKMTSGREDIEQSLQILLSTELGERVIETEYGCDLSGMIFESIDLSLETLLKDKIETSILYYEPRITLEGVSIDTTKSYEGIIMIGIDYTIRITNSRYNFVFPFYKEEGGGM